MNPTEPKIRYKHWYYRVSEEDINSALSRLEGLGWWLEECEEDKRSSTDSLFIDSWMKDDSQRTKYYLLILKKPYVCKSLNTSTKTRRQKNYLLRGSR